MKSVYLVDWFPGGSSSGIKGQPSWSKIKCDNPFCDSHSRNACAYEIGKLGIRQGSCVEIPKCRRWNIIGYSNVIPSPMASASNPLSSRTGGSGIESEFTVIWDFNGMLSS
ncbi:unnamed protein product [Ilex paraguariensis]|uniref:Uncharacterized protein n=1 Tax=Ilex paraguariensis TaxID=185542 RepID=A0ABC8UB39_9AQUA